MLTCLRKVTMKVVIIGAAGHAGLALDGRERRPKTRITAAAPGSPDEDISEFYKGNLQEGGTKYYDDYHLLLDREKPDVAVVSPFFNLHTKITLECIERGIHTFVEKPAAFTLEGCERLEKEARRNNTCLAAMLPYRYYPEFQAAYSAVKEGMVGEPLLLTAQKSYKLGKRAPFYRKRLTFGGTILWVGIHAVDWVYRFSGGQIAEVTASHTVRDNDDHDELESSALCLYRLRNSGAASVNIDYFRPAGAETHGDDRLRVAGKDGIVEIINGEAVLLRHDCAAKKLAVEPKISIFGDFIRQIEYGTPMRISTSEMLDITRIAILTLQAADQKRPVHIPEKQ